VERPAGCSVIPAGSQVRRDVAARKPSLGLRRGQMKSAAGGSPLPAAFGPATLRRRQARKPSLRFSRGQMETKRPPGGPIDPAALVAGPPRAGPISIAHGNEISRWVSAVPGGREVWPQGAARKPSLRLSRGQMEKNGRRAKGTRWPWNRLPPPCVGHRSIVHPREESKKRPAGVDPGPGGRELHRKKRYPSMGHEGSGSKKAAG